MYNDIHNAIIIIQVDLIGMPPVVSNRVLKRQPLNIYYLRKHLLESPHQRIPQRSAIISDSERTTSLTVQNVSQDISGRHFEEELPVNSFTSGTLQTRLERHCLSLETESVQEDFNTGKMSHLSVEVPTHDVGATEGDDCDVPETEGNCRDDEIGQTDGESSTI